MTEEQLETSLRLLGRQLSAAPSRILHTQHCIPPGKLLSGDMAPHEHVHLLGCSYCQSFLEKLQVSVDNSVPGNRAILNQSVMLVAGEKKQYNPPAIALSTDQTDIVSTTTYRMMVDNHALIPLSPEQSQWLFRDESVKELSIDLSWYQFLEFGYLEMAIFPGPDQTNFYVEILDLSFQFQANPTGVWTSIRSSPILMESVPLLETVPVTISLVDSNEF